MRLPPLKLKTLENKYGRYASWAIWNPDPSIKMDTEIIMNHVEELHSTVVMVGLNISNALPHAWSNFHFGPHDRYY